MIEKLLISKIGLNFDSIGRKGVEELICRHIRDAGLSSEQDFHDLLTTDEASLDKLCESLLIPETWFFRYPESFAFLASHAQDRRSGLHGRLRVLSVPCASGEEPYSIAMTLLNSGFTSDHFKVDAVDVSKNSLERAKVARYGSNSFRGDIPAHIQNRFFRIGNGQYTLLPQVAEKVDFERASVLDPDFASGRSEYDVIFCRNLLIYFQPPEQARAIQVLTGLLRPGGVLFLGHAESGILSRKEFTPATHPSSFAFYKNSLTLSGKSTAAQTSNSAFNKNSLALSGKSNAAENNGHHLRAPRPADSKTVKSTPVANEYAPPLQQVEMTQLDDANLLGQASILADRGELQSAESLCLRCLERNKLNPSTFFLLGVICLSAGRLQDAEKAFRKAIYLNPEHSEALLNLALVKERLGESTEASSIRERARRLKTKTV